MMESRESNFDRHIKVTPEKIAALRAIDKISEEKWEILMETRKKIQESGQKLPIPLMTWEEYFDEAKRRAAANPRITVRPEDI